MLVENKLGVESWCVKFLLPYVHNKLLLYRQRKHWLDRDGKGAQARYSAEGGRLQEMSAVSLSHWGTVAPDLQNFLSSSCVFFSKSSCFCVPQL